MERPAGQDINFVAYMTWDGVERRLAGGAAAILPIGAGAKEHGLHLPMNTDEVQADWLASQIAGRHDAIIWPALRYGHYPAFTDFPGSISLSKPAFMSLTAEIVAGIAAWKPRAIFILNTGISTLAPVDAALASKTWGVPVVHLRIHEGTRYKAAAQALARQAFGSHADELETSRMMIIAPETINLARAERTPSGPFDGPLTRENTPSGSYGDPTLATASKGQVLIDTMLADLDEAVDRALQQPL